jgi:hypothetical protein
MSDISQWRQAIEQLAGRAEELIAAGHQTDLSMARLLDQVHAILITRPTVGITFDGTTVHLDQRQGE